MSFFPANSLNADQSHPYSKSSSHNPPNSDGLNDFLCVMGDRIVKVNLKIFNRWGENVFSTKNQLDCWDGFFKMQPVDPGSLVYSLHLVLDDGEQISKSGNINIVR